jgi:WD40-like Beta Propeller Repeat
MSEARVHRLLRQAPVPGGEEAGERAWHVVRQAFAEREPIAWPRRHWRPLAALVVAGALVGGAFTSTGSAVLNSIRDAVGREKVAGVERAAPALISLPAPGRLLVTAGNGPWIVNADGSKRHLGAYDSGGWSPHGLFEVVSRGRALVAVDPSGNVRWTIMRARPIGGARWAPDGYRIAYRAGSVLHVVAGDSTGDRVVARAVAPVAPAWRPEADHVLTFVGSDGRISTYAVDSGRLLWRAHPPQPPQALSWSPDGRFLLVVGRSKLTLYDAGGKRGRELLRPTRARVLSAAFSPDGRAVAYVLRTLQGSVLWLARPAAASARRLFAGGGDFSGLTWSPDGRWLLLAWKSADQWLFIRVTRPQKLLAVSDISAQFSPGTRRAGSFPVLNGWCCSSTGRAG